MSLATRIESLVIRVAQEFNDVRAQGRQPGQPHHHRQVKSGRGHQRTESRRGVVGGDRRCARRGHDHVLVQQDRLTARCAQTEIWAVPMPPTTRRWKSSNCCRTAPAVWMRCFRRRQQPRALRCGAVADRGRATSGAQQHRCRRVATDVGNTDQTSSRSLWAALV